MESRGMLDALVRSRKGLAALGGLGGLALVAGLAYRALRPEARAPDPLGALAANEDEARLCLRVMVAAASADGLLDEREREHLDKAVIDAAIGADGTEWLAAEIASPADVDTIAAAVDNPEMAARVYTAARLAVSLDNLQEREFMKRLAEALDLAPEVAERIDAAG